MLPVAVLAGGLGNRLRVVTGDTLPKALVPVLGRPFIDWKLEELAAAGAHRVILLVGHHGSAIREHVGSSWHSSLEVECVDDGPTLVGTGGALVRALPLLGDAFWVTYGDSLIHIDMERAEARFRRAGVAALMTVLHNQDRFQPSNVVVAGDLVVAYSKDPPPTGAEHIDYGMLAFRRDAIPAIDPSRGVDLTEILATLVDSRQLGAFEVTEQFHDIGTPQALRETERFLLGRLNDA